LSDENEESSLKGNEASDILASEWQFEWVEIYCKKDLKFIEELTRS
jgi:hypothetical protein